MLAAAIPARLPTSAEEVQALIAETSAHGRRIEVIGGGTKRSIAPVTADVTLSLAGLDKVIDYAPDELVLTVQAGARLADLEKLVASEGQMLAFEPPRWTSLLRSSGAPTIGGALAANLSGPRRIRAGAARDHFLGFSAVSGRGEVFKAGGKVVKNVTGYDLMKLMAGSWGTLAVLTEVTIKVLPAPREETTLLLFGLADARAVRAMTQALNGPFEVSAAAHLPPFAAGAELAVTALRLEGFEASVAARAERLIGSLRPFGRVERLDAAHSREFWRDVREVKAFAGDPRPLWRVSVPPAHGWRIGAEVDGDVLYDWAGGLVWLLTDADAPAVDVAADVAGGHAYRLRGSGPVVMPSAAPLDALNARVKAAFDPLEVLNPGRSVP
ncbi:glycolate oxidase subunit GlcE [Phenylobacterium sp. J426]|uniref:glycolate oxidase subunit GlcE n=1 Tax=Phenylobacterium sp. J426 TaxID=2898439 RepID=UPI0021512F49|nr:glycolate oxidase subunit GlcE [Phenylobacterium sp. J426]MCR5874507.1 glycolate oxidase subunit GlcE [Phenylobacterium sp. J426]